MKRILILMLICSKLNAQFEPDDVIHYPTPIEFELTKFPFNVATGFYWNKNSLISTSSASSFSFELSSMIRDVENSSNKFLGIETGRAGCYRTRTFTIQERILPDDKIIFDNLIDGQISITDLDTRRQMSLELLQLLDKLLKSQLSLGLRNVQDISVSYTQVVGKNAGNLIVTFSFTIIEPIKCPDSN